MLTVRDIPSIKGLKDICIRAGRCFADNAIRWPYVAEEYELDQWLKGGEVVFITGINRRWTDDDFARLVGVLKRKNAAAIVVLTGSKHMPELKGTWLRLCDENQMPLLEQPYNLPMVTVTERISNAIVQDTFAQRSKQWFIQQLADSGIPPEAMTLEQAKHTGLPVDVNLSVAMLIPDKEQIGDLEAWLFLFREFLAQQKSPFPVVEYRNGWLLCLTESDSPEQKDSLKGWDLLMNRLTHQGLIASIGVSNGHSLEGFYRMVCEARQCAEFAARHFPGQLHHHQTFGLQRLFASVENTELLYDFCRRYLGVFFLSADSDMIAIKQTVTDYFNNLCSLRKTAETLRIHRNTVCYRLNKFEALTHLSLNDPNTRLCVQNALLMEVFILPHHD